MTSNHLGNFRSFVVQLLKRYANCLNDFIAKAGLSIIIDKPPLILKGGKLLSSNVQTKLPKKDIPVLNMPDIYNGCLSGSPGDVSRKYCDQSKRGTRHINIKEFMKV